MTTYQPAAPAAPAAPSFPAGADAPSDLARQDLARQIDNANRAVEQAGRMAEARAAAAGRASSVVKDPGGRIVVTGPDGKTITIDPKAGLNGDQIQEMVQTALQPTPPLRLRRDDGPPGTAVAIVAIIFTFLFLIAIVISRAVRRRPVAAGASTAVLPPETVARLARIEQAVEAVAIEVERISEAQRYSAQLLTDRLAAPALAAAPVARTLDAPAARG